MQGHRYEYKMFLALVKVPYCLCAVCWHTMWLHERKWNLEIQEQNEQNTKEMNYDEMECKWKNTRKFWNQVKVFKWNRMIWGTVKSFKTFQNDTYWNFKIKERSEPQRQEKNYDEICSGAQHMGDSKEQGVEGAVLGYSCAPLGRPFAVAVSWSSGLCGFLKPKQSSKISIFWGWGAQPVGAAKGKSVEGAMVVQCIGVFCSEMDWNVPRWHSLNSRNSISFHEMKSPNQRRRVTKHRRGGMMKLKKKKLKEILKILK